MGDVIILSDSDDAEEQLQNEQKDQPDNTEGASGSNGNGQEREQDAPSYSRAEAFRKGQQLAMQVAHASKNLMKSASDKNLVSKMKKHILKCSPDILCSPNFHDSCEMIKKGITDRPASVFIFLKKFADALKNKSITSDVSNKRKLKTVEDQNDCKRICTVDATTSNGHKDVIEDSVSDDFDEKTQRKIVRLESLLKKLHEKLQSYYEKDIGLDSDEDESIFYWEERLEKRIMLVWKKLCQLTKRKELLGRYTDIKVTYEGSRYPEINVEVERFLNRKKIFPDFPNILNLVGKVNADSSLYLPKAEQEVIAKQVFEDVVKILQRRRVKDFVDSFGCRLTDTSWNDDPADKDPELQKLLMGNARVGEANMNELLRSYSQKAIDMNLTPEEVPEEEADDSPDDDNNGEEGDGEDEQENNYTKPSGLNSSDDDIKVVETESSASEDSDVKDMNPDIFDDESGKNRLVIKLGANMIKKFASKRKDKESGEDQKSCSDTEIKLGNEIRKIPIETIDSSDSDSDSVIIEEDFRPVQKNKTSNFRKRCLEPVIVISSVRSGSDNKVQSEKKLEQIKSSLQTKFMQSESPAGVADLGSNLPLEKTEQESISRETELESSIKLIEIDCTSMEVSDVESPSKVTEEIVEPEINLSTEEVDPIAINDTNDNNSEEVNDVNTNGDKVFCIEDMTYVYESDQETEPTFNECDDNIDSILS